MFNNRYITGGRVGRGILISLILWRPPYIVYPLFFKFYPTPLWSPTLNSTALSAVIFLCVKGWLHHIWCAILLNDIMDPQISNLGTSVPEGPWYVFYATRHQVYSGLTHVIFCWYSGMISDTQIHKQSVTSRLTHPYKYIFTPPVLCSEVIFITLNE